MSSRATTREAIVEAAYTRAQEEGVGSLSVRGIAADCGVSIGKVKLMNLVKASLPFVGVMYLVLMLITLFPELILFIPQNMG